MEIIRTYDEMKEYFSTIKDKTVGHLKINRKPNIKLFIHEGHIKCLNNLKENYDLCAVSYWDDNEQLLYMYGNELEEIFFQFKEEFSIKREYDLDGFKEWSYTNEIDVLINLQEGEIQKLISIEELKIYKEWVENYWKENNFYCYHKFFEYILKTFMIRNKVIKEKNISRKDGVVFSWKDGYWRILEAYFIRNYLSINAHPIEPILDKEGLIRRVGLYDVLSDNEKNWIKSFPVIIEENKNKVKNIEIFKQDITDKINSLDPTGEFHVTYLEVYDNKITFPDKYIELEVYINEKFRTSLVRGRFPYIYKIE